MIRVSFNLAVTLIVAYLVIDLLVFIAFHRMTLRLSDQSVECEVWRLYILSEKTDDAIGWSDDILQRKKYADFLTQYLVDKESSFVININAPWGSGKTFFIKHWHEDIKVKYPSVLFNAWKNDFSNDPLLSVISCIDKSLSPLLSNSDQASQEITALFSHAGRLVKSIAPILTKALFTKVIGSDGVGEIKEAIEIDDDDGKAVTEIVGKVTGELIKNNKKAEQSIEDFQKALKALVDALTVDNNKSKGKSSLKKPLFIFIDELDRCRPLYAIELLERIKHLFGVPGIVFVIATDTEQLKHSVNAIYGSGFDSGVYLRRFFDQSYTLPIPDFVEYAKLKFCDFEPNNRFSSYSISKTGKVLGYHQSGNGGYKETKDYTLVVGEKEFFNQNELAELVLLFAIFSAFFNLDLRTQNQCYEKLIAIISFIPEREKIQFAYLTFLVMFEAKSPAIFKEYFSFSDEQNSRSNERNKLINSNFNSFCNLRVGKDLYKASDFVEFYSEFAFVEQRQIISALNNASVNSIKSFWLQNISGDNCQNIKRYKERVEIACQLG